MPVPRSRERLEDLVKIRAAYEDLKKNLWEEAFEQWRKKEEEEKRRKETEVEEEEEEKPTLVQSREKLLKAVTSYDDDLTKAWKEDIDTLLVFGGLFSAVVTAFVIESYQWLKQDPQDTTVILLQQISQQINGSRTASELPSFTPEPSYIRINCFWFLSLILSLTSALFGLLCKQWIREHQRETPTRTPGEALALRQLRRDSFEKWSVSSFLSALPILLEIALLLFFAGVLDLLWTLHHIPFGICFAAIVLSVGLYFLTTFLPTITVPRDQTSFIKNREFGQLAYQFICPYKSPQAWAVYKLSTQFIRQLLTIPLVDKSIKRYFRAFWDHVQYGSQVSSWSTFDLQVVRQFDQEVLLSDALPVPVFHQQVYELQAFQWAVTMFRDSPSMIPHLENVLETLPASVAISAILGRWGVPMWTEVSKLDVGRHLRYPDLVERWPEPVMKEPSLHHHGGNELLFSQQYWKAWMDFFQTPLSHPDNSGGNFSYFEDIITNSRLKRSIGLCFVIPFPIIDALWSHPNLVLRKQSLRLLQHAEESWKPYPGYDEKRHDMERITFAGSLAKHINRTDCTSQLLSSKRGQIFIQFIHDEIIARRLYSHVNFFVVGWRQAIQRTQEIGRLSPGYFKPIPRYGEDPPTATPSTGIQAIRYSVETEQSVQYHVAVLIDDPQTSNGGGEGTSAHSPTRIEHELRQSGVPRDSGDEQVNGTPASGEIVRDGSRKGMLGQLEWNLKLMTGPNTLRYYPP